MLFSLIYYRLLKQDQNECTCITEKGIKI